MRLPLPPVDLATLLSEMAALKAEVRAETRATRDQREALAASAEALAREFDAARRREERLAAELAAAPDAWRRAEVFRLVGLCDRVGALERAAAQAPPPPRGWWRRRRRVDAGQAALAEGLGLLVASFEDALAGLGAARVKTRGATLDVRVMEAVATITRGDLPAFAVVDEVASGWVLGERTLRAAKVVVNSGAAVAAMTEASEG